MNASELALKMLEWEQQQTKADELADEIKRAVLEIGKTQTVGNVRASYSKGRGRYDYEKAWFERGMEHTDVDIEDFRKAIYDYTGACKEAGIDMTEYYSVTSGPSVSLKLS